MRLAVSVMNSALRADIVPGDAYVTITEAPAWEALSRLAQVHPRFAHYTFREVCGLQPVPKTIAVRNWLAAHATSAAPILDVDIRTTAHRLLRSRCRQLIPRRRSRVERIRTPQRKNCRRAAQSPRQRRRRPLQRAPPALQLGAIRRERQSHRRTPHRASRHRSLRRVRHAVYAPIAGTSTPSRTTPRRSITARIVILATTPALANLSSLLWASFARIAHQLKVGQPIARGERFAALGTIHENGGWPPHLHFQFILDLLDLDTNFPGVAFATERAVWTSLSPVRIFSPDSALKVFAAPQPTPQQTLATRRILLGKKSQRLLRKTSENNSWLDAVSLRRHRPQISRLLQQRPARRPQPSRA